MITPISNLTNQPLINSLTRQGTHRLTRLFQRLLNTHENSFPKIAIEEKYSFSVQVTPPVRENTAEIPDISSPAIVFNVVYFLSIFGSGIYGFGKGMNDSIQHDTKGMYEELGKKARKITTVDAVCALPAGVVYGIGYALRTATCPLWGPFYLYNRFKEN